MTTSKNNSPFITDAEGDEEYMNILATDPKFAAEKVAEEAQAAAETAWIRWAKENGEEEIPF
jgi:hypothetical protein